jgi:hypothetical protein
LAFLAYFQLVRQIPDGSGWEPTGAERSLFSTSSATTPATNPKELPVNSLFQIISTLDHDMREDKTTGQKVHSYTCRRCALAVRLQDFKMKVKHLLDDIDFMVGEP